MERETGGVMFVLIKVLLLLEIRNTLSGVCSTC